MPTSNEIRKAFLDYFAGHGHQVVPSSPLVPHNDPTLLFTNAGMVQFKNVFTGIEQRPYKRAVTSQKCVRAGGKHNDLDNVGYTARHHTFFEMLGNFSFGDYFKDLAIELAWKLVTEEYGLPADKLLVTVYAEDDQAFDLWRKIAGLPERRILRIPTSDNFWAMGDTGPCGPCSEIFYDHGPGVPGGPPGSANEDGDRFIEIWNLVFMQFEQLDKATRVDLPRPSIDTGMGLERVAAVLQGKHDNYDIDLFRRLIEASEEITGTRATGAQAPSHKVIADHLRACSFLIADGVMPSNEGRGYVMRRIMRRAMRHAHLLGAREPVMWRLVPVLVAEMGQAFSELVRAESLITEILKLEEIRFRDTLERGLRLLDEATAQPRRRRRAARRDRLQALRHLRLPARSDPGRAARQGHDGRPRGLRAGDGAAARRGAGELARLGRAGRGAHLVRAARAGRRHRVFGLRARYRRGAGARPDRRRPAGRPGRARQRGHGGHQPDAVLWRIRRPDRRYRRDPARPGARAGDRYAKEAGRPYRPYRQARGRPARGRRHGRAFDRCRAPQQAPARAFGNPPAARGAAPPSRQPRRPERFAGGTRPAALRLQPPQARERHRARGDRGRGQLLPAPERCHRDPPDGSRCGDRRGRHGAVRREVRRRGPRGEHGPRARRPRHLGRALRRHARAAHRRHSALQGRGRGCGRGRRAPDRGADRRGRARARQRRGAPLERSRGRAAGHGRRSCPSA